MVILCCIGLATVFILMGNNNNIPEAFSERIFKPISREYFTFYYVGIILMFITYYSLYGLNEVKESKLLKTGFRRIVVTFMLMGMFPSIWGYFNIFYKGFSKDLNSIYLYRDRSSVSFNSDENSVSAFGHIYIKNCSSETQKFYLKIKLPAIVRQDINEEYFTIKNEFRVPPKEERDILIFEDISEDRTKKWVSYGASAFEYVLFNDNEEVVFKGTIDDYKYDTYPH